MIIEKFRPGREKDIYLRFDQKGRMLPDGVQYINSWINENVSVCYQLMETEEEAKLFEWISNWEDLAEFEVVRVISSAAAKEKVFAGG